MFNLTITQNDLRFNLTEYREKTIVNNYYKSRRKRKKQLYNKLQYVLEDKLERWRKVME